jgi:hypothetical protein
VDETLLPLVSLVDEWQTGSNLDRDMRIGTDKSASHQEIKH